MPKANDIPEEQWEAARDEYELGYRHAFQIAEELGVSPQTVMRQMRKRGAVKACRVGETIRGLEDALARKAEARVLHQVHRDALARQHVETSLAILDGMMQAIYEADRKGDLALASDVVAETAAAFGAPMKGRRKRPQRSEPA